MQAVTGGRTHVDVAEVTGKDAERARLVRAPQARGAVPARGRKVDAARAPLHVPDGLAVTAVRDDVRVRLEAPQSHGRVLRRGEQVPRWARGARDRVERDGVDGARVPDELARGWPVGIAKGFEARGWERLSELFEACRGRQVLTIRDRVRVKVGAKPGQLAALEIPQADVAFREAGGHQRRVLRERDRCQAVAVKESESCAQR